MRAIEEWPVRRGDARRGVACLIGTTNDRCREHEGGGAAECGKSHW
jgi:hypothetical protein